jgi:branched-chain amino acid aminotransferase
MDLVNLNGRFIKKENAGIRTDDQSYRYGNGLFETMKVKNGKIVLQDLHFDRLFHSFSVLKFQLPSHIKQQMLAEQVVELCRQNNCATLARIRLSFSAGYGGLYDAVEDVQYLIECWPLQDSVNELNRDGLVIDLFPDARKSCDIFSNLKSVNFLPYVMAAKYAKQKKLNDCLVMNVHERVADATTANLFWIKEKNIFTPPLAEGCIAGVMRKYLLEKMRDSDYELQEKFCEAEELDAADEIFLTNAVHAIRWVKQFRLKTYSADVTKKLFDNFRTAYEDDHT